MCQSTNHNQCLSPRCDYSWLSAHELSQYKDEITGKICSKAISNMVQENRSKQVSFDTKAWHLNLCSSKAAEIYFVDISRDQFSVTIHEGRRFHVAGSFMRGMSHFSVFQTCILQATLMSRSSAMARMFGLCRLRYCLDLSSWDYIHITNASCNALLHFQESTNPRFHKTFVMEGTPKDEVLIELFYGDMMNKVLLTCLESGM